MATGWKNQYYRYREYLLNISKIYYSKPDVRMFLEIILTLSITIIFTIFAIKPTLATIISLTKEIKAKEELLSQLKKKVVDLETARNLYATNSTKIALIHSAVPSQPTPDNLIKQLEYAATTNSVQISGLSVSEINLVGTSPTPPKKTTVKQLTSKSSDLSFSLNASGNYTSLINFIKTIESLRRIAIIDTISFSSSTKETGIALRLSITGRSVYYNEK